MIEPHPPPPSDPFGPEWGKTMIVRNMALAVAVAVLLAVVIGVQLSGHWNCC